MVSILQIIKFKKFVKVIKDFLFSNGFFGLTLGLVTPFSASTFSNNSYFGIIIDNDELNMVTMNVMAVPKTVFSRWADEALRVDWSNITSVPMANEFVSGNFTNISSITDLETLGLKNNVLNAFSSQGRVGIGIAQPGTTLDINGAVTIRSVAAVSDNAKVLTIDNGVAFLFSSIL